MTAIEFYKFSIIQYPTHKDKGSLEISLHGLKEEQSKLKAYIAEVGKEADILLEDLVSINEAIEMGESYTK